MIHKFAEVEFDSGTPIDFWGRRMQAIVRCSVCRETWVITYDVPMKAVEVLQPEASSQRIEDFFKVFENLIMDKARYFIRYNSEEKPDPDSYPPPKQCTGNKGV